MADSKVGFGYYGGNLGAVERAPQQQVSAPAPAAWNGEFINYAALQAAQDANRARGGSSNVISGDPLLQALNSLSGISVDQNTVKSRQDAIAMGQQLGGHMEGSGEGAQWVEGSPSAAATSPLVYNDAFGRTYRETGKDAQGNPLIQFFDSGGGGWENPTGGKRDRVQPTYSLSPDGTAKPVSAGAEYRAGDWVDTGQPIAQLAAVMAAAYFGGAGLEQMGAGSAGGAGASAGGAGAGGAEAVSGMDLAADAALGTGNNVTTAGSVFGGGATASGGLGEVANTGSDAHFYNNPTAAEGGLGNMGGAGTSTIPSMSLGGGSSSLGSYLKDLSKAVGGNNSGGTGGNSILAMLGGGGGMTAGDRYRQQLTSQALRDQASQQAPQQMPGWIPGG